MDLYRKKNAQPMEPWTDSADMSGIAISDADRLSGSPKAGDMIAHNPNDTTDRWLVSRLHFEENYEPA